MCVFKNYLFGLVTIEKYLKNMLIFLNNIVL